MMNYKIIILTIFCLFFALPNQSLAEEISPSSKFNFDADYSGEEIDENKNYQSAYDPFEVVNRKIFAFNEVVDKNIALPIVRQYRRFTPKPVRDSVHNFVTNLSAPFSVVNSLLQGEGNNALAGFSSFLINSTFGVAGLFDVAGERKIVYRKKDLGQTLAKYGSNPGPYLVIPFLGPSNVRDFSGFAVERFVDPLGFNAFNVGGNEGLVDNKVRIGLSLLEVVDTREGLIEVIDDIRANSFDTYATVRSAYLQRRKSLISN